MQVILGAGLAGLGAGLGLVSRGERDFIVLERSGRVGGLAGSVETRGWIFDHTGHFLHLRNPDLRRLLSSLVELASVERRAAVYYHGRFVPYPFQSNLAFLDEDEVLGLVSGAIDAYCHPPPIESFRDWIIASVGERIADAFLIPYNRKLYGVELDSLTPEQGGKYIPKVSLIDIVRGAISRNSALIGYNATFLYPLTGGMQAIPSALAALLDGHVLLNHEVTAVDAERCRVYVRGEGVIEYEPPLISSIPLPTLVRLLLPSGAKSRCELALANRSLKATRILSLNIAVRGALSTPYHWIYVSEGCMPFYRVGSQSNVNPSTAPKGCSSLWAEVNIGHDRPIPAGELDALVNQVIRGISVMGLLSRDARIEFVQADDIWPGYVLFLKGQTCVVTQVRQVLHSAGIETIGRYGRWTYLSMEESIMDGITAVGASTASLAALAQDRRSR